MSKSITKAEMEADTAAASDEGADGSGEGPGPGEAGASRIPQDELFHLLQNERRRRALQYILERDGTVGMREVAERLAAIENDVEVAALTSAQRKRVYVSLYQCHLPKLDEATVIDYDKDRGRIEPTPRIDQLEPYLAVESNSEDASDGPVDRSELPAVATVLGAVLTAAAWSSVLPAPGLWLPVVLTVMFGLATFAAAIK